MKIYPSFDLEDSSPCRDFVCCVEHLLEQFLPTEVLTCKEDSDLFFQKLIPHLPLVQASQGGNAFRITLLSAGEYTHGIGRYLSDALSRQFIPGKIVDLVAARTLCFYFYPDSKKEFVLSERWIMVNDLEERALIRERMSPFIEELRITLLSIVKARHFLSLNSHVMDESALFFSEIQHPSIFEEMQKIVRRLKEEKAVGEIRKSLLSLYERRPKIFDRGIFEEMQTSISFYGAKFIGARSSRYTSRLICYHFYFQKKLAWLCENAPLNHHLLLKLFPMKEGVGVLICMNHLNENELFKKQHFLEAISRSLPSANLKEDSFLMDVSSPSGLFFYLEIERAEGIGTLKARLPIEIKKSIQRTVNPLFMLRNAEDHMRYLIALTQELRHVKDIPQIVIFFEEQMDEALVFSIILVRVLKRKARALKDLLGEMPLKTFLREQKTMGSIGKYPKEASQFQVFLPKEEYLRKDHSLDLPKARQKLLSHLNRQFQQVRDYNGGFLSKQFESLSELKVLLAPLSEDNAFVLENYFFSIEPLASQMTLQGGQLKEGFLLLLHLLETNIPYQIGGSVAGCISSSPKERQHLRAFLDLIREECPDISYSLAHYHSLFCCILFLPQKSRRAKRLFRSFFSLSE